MNSFMGENWCDIRMQTLLLYNINGLENHVIQYRTSIYHFGNLMSSIFSAINNEEEAR